LLGKSLIETKPTNFKIAATYIGEYPMEDLSDIKYTTLDIRDHDGNERLFKEFKPNVIIHTAGIGSPDYAEQHKEETWDINIGGTMDILSLCQKNKARLVYISSNGVYDGERAPYSEKNKPEPVNYYGELKLKAEKIIMKSSVSYAIVRPILMYGWNHSFERSNIVTHALKMIESGLTVHVYDDVFITPLYSIECGKAIWKIIKENKSDVFNIAGAERVSIYQMIKKLAVIFDRNEDLVKPVQQGFFNELVRRPRDTSFTTDKMQSVLHIKPLTLLEGLTAMKANRKQ